MPDPKTLKKSETLEIRIPHLTKQAFMARCRKDGRSASEAMRDFIDQHLDDVAPRVTAMSPTGRKRLRLAIGALIVAVAGASALPSLARPSPQTEFQRLDLNGDGRISQAELAKATQVSAQLSVGPSPLTARAERLAMTDASPEEARLRDALVGLEFRRIDADGDGAISLAEYQRHCSSTAFRPALGR